jgi:hypothetical protein
MNKKLTKADAVKRAAQDFKTLIIYYNVTRPQQLPYFKRNGKFSIKEMKRQINFGGKSMDEVKNMNLNESQFKNFIACQTHYNYTFGIPSERVKKVLSSYRDESGKTHYIHIDDVLPTVEADIGTIEHKSHGEAWGKYSFCGKWMMDEAIRDKYLKDSKWSDIYTAPNVSKRFKEFLKKWIEEDRKRNNKKHTEEKDMTVDELKDEIAQEAAMDNTILPDVQVKVEDPNADIPPEPPKQESRPVVEEKQPEPVKIRESKKQLSHMQIRMLEHYMERFRSGVLSRETFRKYIKEEFSDVLEATAEYIKENLK